MLRQSLILLFVLAARPLEAVASSSAWLETQGGRVRLVTAGAPDAHGLLTGALQIDLLPGWKTYWRDPGEAGVPPVVDVSASPSIVSAELSFPAPHRFDDGYSKWAGYKHSVALPVKFTLKGSEAGKIDADIFLGICETICIPVQGRLEVDPAGDPGNAADTALVEAAFAALPKPEHPGFGVKLLASDAGHVEVEAHAPAGAEPIDFFLAGEQGYVFGTPERREAGGKVRFSIPLLARPATAPTQGALRYTLTTDAGAVEGALPFP
ncbi:protein-disulfide reductase DsbD domain-containing protein [Mesorhizobium sp. L-8-3]|uniref:protein-disulfide reductase DsbD domain-containing protein n=1 Tax=Mesorhizobium sp. L-8-3 TaxID=2744522 RepID=UPI0019278419|nr:protein-disulfide reductase DsbD domain-containing protein [Mesorhizobium sp. L-8-3]